MSSLRWPLGLSGGPTTPTLSPLAAPASPRRGPAAVAWAVADMARRRTMRISVLLIAATLLGLADLALTLTYLTSIGMFEGNPVARLVIASGSAWTVAAFKVLTIALTVWITLIMRRRWQAEMLAWLSAVAMLGLFLHWLGYIAYAEASTTALAAVALDPSYAAGNWVSLR